MHSSYADLCHADLQGGLHARVLCTLGCAKHATACGSIQQHSLACAAVRQQHAELRRQLEAGALATPSSTAGSPGACSEAAAQTLPPQVRVTSDTTPSGGCMCSEHLHGRGSLWPLHPAGQQDAICIITIMTITRRAHLPMASSMPRSRHQPAPWCVLHLARGAAHLCLQLQRRHLISTA